MQVKKQQLEPDMEHQTGSKLGKEYVKAVYCHPAYLTYMQSTSCKLPGWIKHKMESKLPGNVSNLKYADDTTLMAESEEELKSLLMKVKEKSEKVGLKLTLCDTMDCSTPGFPVHHQLPKTIQSHVHRLGDAIQPSHPLSSPCPPALNSEN